LLPPVKLYENQEANKSVLQNNRDLLGFQDEAEKEKDS
jgi:hypothetical protein